MPDARDIGQIVAARPRMSDLNVQGDMVTSSNVAVQLDFDGYAKGYALDRAAALLRASGIANALVAYRDGNPVASYDKRLLPTYDVFDEDRYFEPARTVEPGKPAYRFEQTKGDA